MNSQHYHLDTNIVIPLIDSEGKIFLVDKDTVNSMRKIIEKAKRNSNIKLIISNPVLGEIFTNILKKSFKLNILKNKPDFEVAFMSIISVFNKIHRDLQNRLIIGYFHKDTLYSDFCEILVRINGYLEPMDRLILYQCALDDQATKFYTNDKNILYNGRMLEKNINDFRREYLNNNVRLRISPPE